MSNILSIVGKTNSGKTTLIEKIISELKKRGYKVGAIKHCSHNFEIDKEGKDSFRMSKAGADTVVVSTDDKIAMIRTTNNEQRTTSLDELVSWLFPDVDIVLTEGYKSDDKPKIEVNRKEVGKELLCKPEELLAVVTDQKLDIDVRCFSFDEISELTDLIEGKIKEV